MNREMLDMVEILATEKNVERAVVLGVLELALASAVKRARFPGTDADVVVSVDPETGDWEAKRRWLIVSGEEGLQEPDREEMLVDVADEHPDLKVGDYIEEPVTGVNSSARRFAQDAKQVILQRLRDAERDQILKDFLARDESVVNGQVKRVTKDGAIVEIGRLEALLPRTEMIPREILRNGDRVRAYVLRVDETPKGRQVILSRSCNEFLDKLFELEVPEIEEGVVEIRASARDPGARAKIAVISRDRRIDPVGTCIGIRGSRVTAVTNELGGEHIDVVHWDEDPVRFIVEALKPAKVTKVIADEETNTMDVTVDEENHAIAIGRGGQNVHLASQLCGWRINIMTAEEADQKRDAEAAAVRAEFSEIGLPDEVALDLFENGIYTLEELAYVPEAEISSLEIFSPEDLTAVREKARSVLLARALKREENLRQADQSLLELPEIDNDIASELVAAGVKTADQLADLDVQELIEITGLDEERAGALIMSARANWASEEDAAQ